MSFIRIRNQSGASNIEIVILILIIGILVGMIAITHKGIDEKQDNVERQRDVDELRVGLESYFSQYDKYPTLNELNDASWRQSSMKGLSKEVLRDPNSTSYDLSATPAKNVYAYQVTATNGKQCNDSDVKCTEYTLTATLEGGGKYVKKNLD